MSRKGKLPFRPHYIDDWAASEAVRAMDMACEGIFLRLLDLQWQQGHVPETGKKVRSFFPKFSLNEWRRFEKFFDAVFPVSDDGKRRNPRCQMERDKALSIVQKRVDSGKKGAEARHGHGVANANGEKVASANREGLANGGYIPHPTYSTNQQPSVLLKAWEAEGGSGGEPATTPELCFFEGCLEILNEVPGYKRAHGTTPAHLAQVWQECGTVGETEFQATCRQLRDKKLGNRALGPESTFALSPCADLRDMLRSQSSKPSHPTGVQPRRSEHQPRPLDPFPDDYEAV